jgi:hypothetical protein
VWHPKASWRPRLCSTTTAISCPAGRGTRMET